MKLDIKIGAIDKDRFEGRLEYIAPQGKEIDGAIQFEIKAALVQRSGLFIRAGYSAKTAAEIGPRKLAAPVGQAAKPDTLTRRVSTVSINCFIDRARRSSFHTMSASPLCANSRACKAGRSLTAPDICLLKIFAHPASVSASRCKARFWSTVDTRVSPIRIGFDVMSPASDDRARATFGAAGRSRRFARGDG